MEALQNKDLQVNIEKIKMMEAETAKNMIQLIPANLRFGERATTKFVENVVNEIKEDVQE